MSRVPNMLCSVFVTDNGLNKHDTGCLRRDFPSRVELFLTSMLSLSNLNWGNVSLYVELDDNYLEFEDLVSRKLLEWFPRALLHHYRLETFAQWKEAVQSVEADSDDHDAPVLLTTNDDHALVPGAEGEFLRLCERVYQSSYDLAVGQVSHFPEVWGRLGRPGARFESPPEENLSSWMTYVSGTVILKQSQLSGWFESDFTNGNRFVRPDNPFGPWAPVKRIPILVPRREVMRHMDGYTHVGIRHPCSPLRPTVSLTKSAAGLRIEINPWKTGLAPQNVAAWTSSERPDLLVPEAIGSLASFRSHATNIQAALSFRIGFRNLGQLRSAVNDSKRSDFIVGFVLAFFSITVLRLIPRYIADRSFGVVLAITALKLKKFRSTYTSVQTLGWKRGLFASIKSKLLSRN